MNVSPYRSILCLALVVLAGCASAGTGPATPPPVTPAPVPSPEPTTTGLAPGIQPNEITADVLAEAHAARLQNTSFTRWEEMTVRYPNGQVRTKVKRFVQSDPAEDRSYIVVDTSGETTAQQTGVTRWEVFLGNRSFTAITYGNTSGPSVIRPANTRRTASDGGYDRLLNRLTSGSDVRFAFGQVESGDVVVTPAVDVVAYVVEVKTKPTQSVTDRQGPNAGNHGSSPSIRNASLEAIVTRSGVVRRFRFSYQTTIGDTTVTVTRSVAYVSIGTTTVKQPDWYDDALNRT